MTRPARAAIAALACAAAGFAGCGDDAGGTDEPAGSRPAEGGTLSIALGSAPDRLDPLLARDRAEQLVSRQIHEPLVAILSGPFGDVRELPGLAQYSNASNDRTIWRIRLRPRVRFQDGRPFNAAAVLANAERWIASAQGRELLPGLTAADAPRPDLVRFILDAPDLAFAQRLSDPRLGIVSPRALASPRRLRPGSQASGTGTGAFELRERGAGGDLVLARNSAWWGTRFDLGPALDQLLFRFVADREERMALLAGGEVAVADDVGSAGLAQIRDDPLLTVAGGDGAPLMGISRSVRGLGAGQAPYLSGAWLTTVGAGS